METSTTISANINNDVLELYVGGFTPPMKCFITSTYLTMCGCGTMDDFGNIILERGSSKRLFSLSWSDE